MPESEGKTIYSVAKAISLLDILTESGRPAALSELYQKTGWPKSTIHGLLSTMECYHKNYASGCHIFFRRRPCGFPEEEAPRTDRAFNLLIL